MGDMADLVSEDGRCFKRRERLEQGVAEQDVTKAGQDAGHAGVDHHLTGIPDQNIGEAKADAAGGVFQPAAQRPMGQRVSRPREPNEKQATAARTTDPARRSRSARRRGILPGREEPPDHVSPEHVHDDDRQSQAERLPPLQNQVPAQPSFQNPIADGSEVRAPRRTAPTRPEAE